MTAEQEYQTIKANVEGLPSSDARLNAFWSAEGNCSDTERELARKLETNEWYELFVSSYYCSLEG